MRLGFVIDQRKCIGCHACTVACKAENQVPLGAFRTWVKYTEKGTFPSVTRSFLVERCNHCDDAPCVAICPVEALWRRDDGIVDFSGDRCIGCKACMAACPYDAIYMDPTTHTLGKCNYCAHRVDRGLQPACVNVCPVEAIITGDLDNPGSRISQLLSLEPAVVRRPEKGTSPKVFYLGADEAAVNPETTSERPRYMMAESDPSKPIRISDAIGYVPSGMVQRDYSVAHARPWGWHVSAYLWTKSIAAGVMLAAALLLLASISSAGSLLTVAAPLLAIGFLGATGLLLILDLERPERFARVLLRPHWTSWLVIGAYIITAYGAVVMLAALAGLLGYTSLYRILMWSSPLLAPHLVVQAALAGSAVLGILAVVGDARTGTDLAGVLAFALAASLALVLVEVSLPHVTAHTRQAIRYLTGSPVFWLGALLGGTAVPLILATWVARGGPTGVLIPGSILALVGLAVYEELYIRAGQSVPLS